MCSFRGCRNSLLGFLRQLCFGSKRSKLSYSIVVRRAIKAYEELCVCVLFCNLCVWFDAAFRIAVFLKICFVEMIFCMFRIVLIIVSAERSLVSGWSTELGCKLLQSLHVYRPSHYAGRNAILWKSLVGFSSIDCMLCESRASL